MKKSSLPPQYEAIRKRNFKRLIDELTITKKNLEGHWSQYDPKLRLVMVHPFIVSGLWPLCERQTFELFQYIRTKRDWVIAKPLCIRTPKTKFLYDLLNKRFTRKRKKKAK